MSIELQAYLEGHNFTKQNCSARPPAIGEESEVTSVDGRMSTHSSVSGKSEVSSATPRRTDIDLGFEPEGSESPLPSCERWKLSLHHVLEDSEGIKLFKEYLANSKQLELLECWLACKGFRYFGTKNNHSNNSSAASSTTGTLTSQRSQMDSATLQMRQRLAKTIFNKYFKKDKCLVSSSIKNATRQYIYKQIKNALEMQKDVDLVSSDGNGELDTCLFDQAQGEIEKNVLEDSYQAFLLSDLFKKYLAQCESKHIKLNSQNLSSHPLSVDNKSVSSAAPNTQQSSSIAAIPTPIGRQPFLPPIDEIREWHPNTHRLKGGSADKNVSSSSVSSAQLSLHRIAIEQSALNLPYEADPSNPAYPYIVAPVATKYYVPPVSANVSDQASSDATSDTLSVTDSSVDGSMTNLSKKSQKRIIKIQSKRNVAAHYPGENYFVPVTRRCMNKQEIANLATDYPEKFFNQLKIKLDKLVEDRRKEAIKAALDDDNDILDNHLERVMKTPAALESPRVNNSPPPDATHGDPATLSQLKTRHSATGYALPAAPPQAVEQPPQDARRSHHAQKELMDRFHTSDYASNSSSRRSEPGRRRKEVAVGMSQNEVPDVPTPIMPVDKRAMIQAWITQADGNKPTTTQGSLPRKRGTSKVNQTTRPHNMYVNRSTGFPIQAVVTSRANQFQSQPLQPISQDHNMPPLDQPDTSTTIEEVKRRLIEEVDECCNPMQCLNFGNRNPLAPAGSHPARNVAINPASSSGVPTLHTEGRAHGAESSAKSKISETTCVYYLPHEKIGYKIHIPHPITLGQFKNVLSRKGNYRYYFKQYSPEIDGPVFFEILEDSATLPLWDNTVVAKVELCNS